MLFIKSSNYRDNDNKKKNQNKKKSLIPRKPSRSPSNNPNQQPQLNNHQQPNPQVYTLNPNQKNNNPRNSNISERDSSRSPNNNNNKNSNNHKQNHQNHVEDFDSDEMYHETNREMNNAHMMSQNMAMNQNQMQHAQVQQQTFRGNLAHKMSQQQYEMDQSNKINHHDGTRYQNQHNLYAGESEHGWKNGHKGEKKDKKKRKGSESSRSSSSDKSFNNNHNNDHRQNHNQPHNGRVLIDNSGSKTKNVCNEYQRESNPNSINPIEQKITTDSKENAYDKWFYNCLNKQQILKLEADAKLATRSACKTM
jgi:hypothetical protein